VFAPAPEAISAAFGLPGSVLSMTAVAGAWSNRVYRLETSQATFAVKEMRNPWADERWQEWLAEAWNFERRALAAGVPAPEPVPSAVDGGCLAWVDRADAGVPVPVRVHRWVDGFAGPPAPVGDAVADWAGRVLATLHALDVEPADRTVFPVLNTETADRWTELTEAAHRAAAPWAGRLDHVAPAVSIAADLARTAGQRPEAEVMTHGDVDQKNLILAPGGPVLCDWDVAMPLVPRRELADVALSLGAWERLDVSRRVIRAYATAGGKDTAIEPPDLGQSLMIGLDWIAFNVECAIGRRPAPPERTALAHRLVPGLIAEVPGQVAIALRVSEALAP
jgi:aminoglycoside phosphotransferase (APT) family kinase protein